MLLYTLKYILFSTRYYRFHFIPITRLPKVLCSTIVDLIDLEPNKNTKRCAYINDVYKTNVHEQQSAYESAWF